MLAASALALGGRRHALIALGAAAAAVAVYEEAVPPPSPESHVSTPREVAQLFTIHGVRAVCLGHTHRPTGVWEGPRFLGNSGAWCPAFHDPLCREPVFPRRPLLLLTREGGELSGGLRGWDGRELAAG